MTHRDSAAGARAVTEARRPRRCGAFLNIDPQQKAPRCAWIVVAFLVQRR